ncbi:MAG: DUF6265 family protein [Pseudomonadota bacterium]
MWRVAMAGAVMLCVGAADEAATLPGWMAGCWVQEAGERWTEECWTGARGGMMMGSSRTGRGDKTVEWEAMQIVLDLADGDGPPTAMAYRAAPGGGAATVFAWAPGSGPGVTFVNAAHDYPQRIRYWREGELLMAEISMADGSKPMRWRYRRQ